MGEPKALKLLFLTHIVHQDSKLAFKAPGLRLDKLPPSLYADPACPKVRE